MTKKVAKKKTKGVEEAKPSSPHIAFTESEIGEVADFINMAWSEANYSGSMADFRKRDKLFSKIHAHHQKLQEYVLEVKKITNPPKKED